MKSNIYIYNEKEFYPRSDIVDLDVILDKKIGELNRDNLIFNITGFLFIRNSIYVVFPYGYRVEKRKNDIKYLLSLFRKISKIKDLNINEYESVDFSFEGEGYLLPTASMIINDFKERGLISIEKIVTGLNIGGKKVWRKTIKEVPSCFTEENTPIFNEIFMKKRVNDDKSLLTEIHKYCIYKSVELFGDLFGLSGNIFEERNIKLPVSKKYAINYLKGQLKESFDDNLIKKIKLMIEFLIADKEHEKEEILMFYTTSFHTIWEYICKSLFEDEYSALKGYIPNPYWSLEGRGKIYTDQIPDIVYLENDLVSILDAKYYNLNKNVPGWGDIVKQIFYEKSIIDTNKSFKLNINAMIFPSYYEEILKISGFSAVEKMENQYKIFAISINTKAAIRKYCYGGISDYRKILNFNYKVLGKTS